MPKIARLLSPAEVDALAHRPGLHAVGGVTGLYLQVSLSRTDPAVLRRSWILRATAPSKKRRDIGLGSFQDVNLQRAREKAREMRDRVGDRCPIAIGTKADPGTMTFQEEGKAYIAAYEQSSGRMFIERCVREAERLEITGVSRVEWWRREARDEVPKRFQLGPNAVAWKLSELLAWVENCAAERVALRQYDSSDENAA